MLTAVPFQVWIVRATWHVQVETQDAWLIDEEVLARHTQAIECAHEDVWARSRPTVRLIDRLLAHPRPYTSVDTIYAGMVQSAPRHRHERCSLIIPVCCSDPFAHARGMYSNLN